MKALGAKNLFLDVKVIIKFKKNAFLSIGTTVHIMLDEWNQTRSLVLSAIIYCM